MSKLKILFSGLTRLVMMAMLLLPVAAAAQKPKAVEFSPDGLPDELLEYLNKSTSDSDKQKENAQVVKAFRASHGAMDQAARERVAAVFEYAVRAKLRPNPEITDLAQTLTAYATAPGGAQNFAAWLQAVESIKKRTTKAKALNEWVEFSQQLLKSRILYSSNSAEWMLDTKTPFRIAVEEGTVWVYVDSRVDLTYSSAKDRNVIHQTRGRYNYKENLWEGRGGRIDWARTGLGAEACYAELGRYRAETKFPKFNADSVMFVNTHYFSSPIMGRVEEVLNTSMEPEKYSYPRFRSYQRDFVITNILPDVDYSGSFMMNGSKFITASSKHPASLLFRQGGRTQLAVTSLKFTITPDKLTAENAAVALYIGEDSISNTGITVRYTPAERRVSLINDPKRNYFSPYRDSYHELDIFCDVITWKTDGGELEFSNLAGTGTMSTANFESSSYYTYRKYREIQGIDDISPVKRVYDYASGGNYNFSVKDFSNYIGLDIGQTLLMIHNLCRHGLVTYNEITGRVMVNEKLEDYMRASTKGKGFDYDALTLESTARGVNARMKIDDNLLVIQGVEQFVVSDSQRVVVYPDSARGRTITVGRNRSIHFDGRIEAGKFVFFVNGCDFSYENFSFDMPDIRKLYFAVPNFTFPDSLHPVMTPLSNLVGKLQVDMPDNHCGLTKNKDFPIFESLENSFVYWDQKNIRGGQYVRDRFYYTLHPFTINNLVDFVTDSVQFNGVLTSAGIFPDITYPLTVQHDYYLGFRTVTPAGGYPAYGGKGTYRRNISLDHHGLQGEGELDYLTASCGSKKFLFLPDSASATVDTITVREERGFPDVRGGRSRMHWTPYADSMAVCTMAKGNPFTIYRGEGQLRGRMSITPQGATAAGSATVHEGTLTSQRFAMLSREMNAEVSDFTLRSNTYNNTAFSAKNVRSHVDYDQMKADLQMSGPQRTELQLVKMEAYADFFQWDIRKLTLDIVNSERPNAEGMDGLDLRQRLGKVDDLPGVRFVSTDDAQQGLTYNSLRSTYRYEQGNLSSGGVYLLCVADAAIAPDADTLYINKGGKMRRLDKASLIADRENAYHYFTDAELTVNGKASYTGKGYITYTGDKENPQRIFFDNIAVENGITVARGNITADAGFDLNPAFGFAGKVRAEGNREWLHFDGGVRLLQNCVLAEKMALLAYSDYTDPENIHINVPEVPADWKGRPISAAILMDESTLRPRAAFLTTERTVDNAILSAQGVLTYHSGRHRYMIGSEAKVSEPETVSEPYLAMNTEDCMVEGEGPMSFALRRTQAGFYVYGTARVGINSSDDNRIATVFGVSFPIAKEIAAAMAAALKDDLRLNPVTGSTNSEMRRALKYHLGAEQGEAVYSQYSDKGSIEKIPSQMRCTMLFDNIRWQYNAALGFYYDGKVGLVGMGDTPMGLEVKLKAQICKIGSKQEMVFYVEAARDHWYFFRYDLQSQELVLYSSSGTWLDMIKALPLEQRRISDKNLGTFRYMVGNNSTEVRSWLDFFTNTLYQ